VWLGSSPAQRKPLPPPPSSIRVFQQRHLRRVRLQRQARGVFQHQHLRVRVEFFLRLEAAQREVRDDVGPLAGIGRVVGEAIPDRLGEVAQGLGRFGGEIEHVAGELAQFGQRVVERGEAAEARGEGVGDLGVDLRRLDERIEQRDVRGHAQRGRGIEEAAEGADERFGLRDQDDEGGFGFRHRGRSGDPCGDPCRT